jgi:hypothetical protein
MLGFSESVLEQIIVHKIGNKSREETLHLSEESLEVDDGIKELLQKYFLSPFKSSEYFNLYHETDINLNEVYSYASRLFDDPSAFVEQSANLACHLYEKSDHPKVLEGEFYVTYITNCIVDGETVEAIGLFKSESKETYLKVYTQSGVYQVESQDGININKLDKGCLIYNSERSNGYLVSVIDNKGKGADAQYWKDDFLKIRQREDNFYHTQNVMKMCKTFVTEKLPQEFEVTKADQADILNKSVSFFKDKEEFSLGDFAQEVMQQPEIIETFNNYKTEYEAEHELVIADDFDISETVVKKEARVLKSVIKLDKNFHIYVHGDRKYITKGYDESTGMHFYQIYFREEN